MCIKKKANAFFNLKTDLLSLHIKQTALNSIFNLQKKVIVKSARNLIFNATNDHVY